MTDDALFNIKSENTKFVISKKVEIRNMLSKTYFLKTVSTSASLEDSYFDFFLKIFERKNQ